MSSKKGISRDAWIILKQAWNLAGKGGGRGGNQCGNTTFEGYKNLMVRYFGIPDWNEDMVIYCLTAQYNDANAFDKEYPNPFEVMGPEDVLIPQIYKYEVEHYPDDYETEIYHDECKDNGESYDYGYDCECQYAVKEVYDEEGGYMDEEECTGYLEDPDCECQEWMDAEVELFWWPIKKSYYFALEDDLVEDGGTIDSIADYSDAILFETNEVDEGYEERETWDYFSDSDHGSINDWQVENIDWEVQELLK